MNIKNLCLLVLAFLILLSCTTTHSAAAVRPDSNIDDLSVKRPYSSESIEFAIDELASVLKAFDQNTDSLPRDIDNREWIMYFINRSADRDMIMVRSIFENLKYRNWTIDEKSVYLKYFYHDTDGAFSGFLMEMRESVWDELNYLQNNSRLLQDTPWVVRDFYDERSEFNYWYLLYLAGKQYPFRIEESILPYMLKLIPEDRINGVTYLWLKNPDSLCNMTKEILDSGYPWSNLLSLMEMNNFIQDQINLMKPDKTGLSDKKRACLF